MTLSEMANFICGKVNQTEAEDVTACKGFLTRRHDLIWNSELWKDALVEYRQTLDPDLADYLPSNNYLPAKGVLLLPPIIQRVLGARTAERTLNIQRPEYYYRIDFDSFSKTGTPAEYILLPPCVWEFNSSFEIIVRRASAADAATIVTADLLDSDGAGVTRTSKTLDEDLKALGESERIDAMSKPTSTGVVSVGLRAIVVSGAGTASANGVYFYNEDNGRYEHSNGNYLEDAGGFWVLMDGATESIMYYLPTLLTGEAEPSTGELPGPTRAWCDAFTIAAAATNASRRQRLRLIEIPTLEQTIRVLGKRVCPTFSADNDEAAINGSDNLLIALGSMDMMQRERQYGKAREYREEAVTLLAELKKLEVVQQVHHQRIIPECGFGDDYFTGGRRGFHF